MFGAGVAGLLFVPVFKTVTHLPPFMGMMLSLGALWMLTERLHHSKNIEEKAHLTVIGVLRKIDTASVLFFLGILLAVASLQEAGHLLLAADWLRTSLNDVYLIDLAIGLLSAIVDNVPLVAASMGMYDIIPAAAVTDAWTGMFVQDGIFGSSSPIVQGDRWIGLDHWLRSRGCGDGPGAHRLCVVPQKNQPFGGVGVLRGRRCVPAHVCVTRPSQRQGVVNPQR